MARTIVINPEVTIVEVTINDGAPVSVQLLSNSISVALNGDVKGRFNTINFKEGANVAIDVTEDGKTADVEIASSGLGGAAIQWQDEGVNLGDNKADTVNFVGNVTASRLGSTITVTLPVDTGIHQTYVNIAALLAGQSGQILMGLYYVEDASGDSTVASGWAIYMKLTTNTASLTDYVKVQEQESIDIVISDASETEKGIVELATSPEARNEDDNTLALTPHSLRAPGGGLGVEIARTLTDSDTLLATDINRKVVFNISSAKNFTIPASVLGAGDIVYVERTGSGTLSFVAGSGMALTSSLGALTDAGENNLVILLFDSPSACKIYNGIPFNLTSNDVVNALGYTPSKRILLYKDVIQNTHTGNTTETILGQYLIPAGTIQADDILVIRGRAAKSGSAGSYNVRIRIGSAGTTSDTQVAIVSPGATQLGTYFKRDIHFENSVSAQEILNTILNAATDEQTTSTAPSDLTINFANQQYISVSINLNNSSDTAILKYFYIEIIRS